MVRLNKALLLSLTLMVAACNTQTTAPGTKTGHISVSKESSAPLPLYKGIQQGKLKNGLKYIVIPNHRPEHQVSLQMVVHAGSLNEDDDQQGIAHLVEHMAFNGTKDLPGDELISSLEARGMVFGRDINAMTEFHTTSYYLHLPDTKPNTLDYAFYVLAQQTQHMDFSQEALEKERAVVEEEWRKGLGVRARMGRATREALLEGSLFAERNPIGDMNLVRNVHASRIEAFYHTWYHPNNMTLIAVGDVSEKEIRKQLETHFGQASAAKLPPAPNLAVPLTQVPELELITDKDITAELLSVYLRTPRPIAVTKAQLRDNVLEDLAMAMLNDQLIEAYETQGEYLLRMTAASQYLTPDYGMSSFMAVVKNGHYEEAFKKMFSYISYYRNYGFSNADFDFAKKSMALRYQKRAERSESATNSSVLNQAFSQVSKDVPVLDPQGVNKTVKNILKTITLEQVNQKLAHIIDHRAPLFSGQIRPQNEDQFPTLITLTNNWKSALLHPPAKKMESADKLPLMSKALPPAAEIIKHKKIDDTHIWTLANGAEIWFQRARKSPNKMMIGWQGSGGTAALPSDSRRAASLAAQNLAQFGYGGHSQVALRKLNTGYYVPQNLFVSDASHGVSGSSDPESLEHWFQNFYLRLTEPQANQSIWSSKQALVSKVITGREKSALGQLSRKVDKVLYPGHPDMQPITVNELQAITAEDMLTAFQQLFTGAKDHHLVAVGDMDPESFITVAQRYIGALPEGKPIASKPLKPIHSGTHKILVKAGSEPKGVTSIYLSAPQSYSQKQQATTSLLKKVVYDRLREALRNTAGGIYSLKFSLYPDRYRGQLDGQFGYTHQPERGDELLSITMTTMRTLVRDGINKDELEQARSQQRLQLKPEVITDQSRFKWLNEAAMGEVTMDMPASYLHALDSVNVEDLNTMIKALWNSKDWVEARLMPEELPKQTKS